MKRNSAFLAVSTALLVLAGCGGSDDSGPEVKVDDQPTGRYIVSLGDADAPSVGKYYAAADGSRLLVVADSDDRGQRLYRRSGNGAWTAVPPVSADTRVTLLRSDALTVGTPDLAALAGGYVTQTASGATATFSVAASGAISAGSSACKLSGQLSAGTLPGTLKLSLATAGCGSLPASSTGVATLDADYAPARLRLVTDDASQVIDLWTFTE